MLRVRADRTNQFRTNARENPTRPKCDRYANYVALIPRHRALANVSIDFHRLECECVCL